MDKPIVMIVGAFGPGAFECSYVTAFEEIGCKVSSFDLVASERRYCRLGAGGRLFNKFVPVESWIRKANREMVLEVRKVNPDVIIMFGQNRILAAAIAQIRAISSAAAVYIWPDTLLNLNDSLISALPLYDLVGTYSKSTVPVFERLGARQVAWMPLGANPRLHPSLPVRDDFRCDVAFIGQWRPEREQAVAVLLAELPGISVKIWGPDWGRRTHNPAIKTAWQKRSLYGAEFAQATASCKINLNIIDDMNYPAANMRFFEIPCAGGLQVCSSCPEMENEFKHGESVFYYKKLEELPALTRSLVSDDSLRNQVAQKAQAMVLGAYTFRHRAQQILESLKLGGT